MAPSLLIVDDHPGMIQVAAKALEGLGQLRFATAGEAALAQMRRSPVDLVLLDAEMPEMSGFEVLAAMKADEALSDIPVVFLTAHDGMHIELKGLELGAADFISKPISPPLLQARVRTQLRIKHLTDELKRIASVDALTELRNRRSFDEALEREWRRAARNGTPISLIALDVDHFKAYNDHYGHPEGDVALRAVARVLHSVARRPGDVAARLGGEEFALLLPETDRDGALHVLEQLLVALGALGLPHAASPTAGALTVSAGLAHLDHLGAMVPAHGVALRRDATRRGGVHAEAAGPAEQAATATVEASMDAATVVPEAGCAALTLAECSRRLDDVRARPPACLMAAADVALYRAKAAGRAQAWRLDLLQGTGPEAARLAFAPSAPRPVAAAAVAGGASAATAALESSVPRIAPLAAAASGDKE